MFSESHSIECLPDNYMNRVLMSNSINGVVYVSFYLEF